MYQTHVSKIRNAFLESPAPTLRAVVKFTLATIQQQFSTVPRILAEWDNEGANAPTLWGIKKKGYKYINEHAEEIAAQLVTQKLSVIDAIDLLLTIPGLGVVKAGLVAQMLGYQVGCIDTHNARIYGVKPDSFRITNKHTAKTRLAKIRSYVVLCEELGGAEHLWDSWCELIAQTQSKHFVNGDDVSALHVEMTLDRIK